MLRKNKTLWVVVVMLLGAASMPVFAQNKIHSSNRHSFSYDILLQRQDVIWGFDFLPDGRILFTERSGKMLTFDPKTKKTDEVSGVLPVWAEGQGGLLDVRVHPLRPTEIYWTYAAPTEKGGSTALARGTLKANKLTDVRRLFLAHEANKNGEHFGSRIEFDGEGNIFFAVGDRGARKQVQDLAYHIGKVLRIKEDGSVPEDNPYVKTKNAQPEIWAQGVRSPQGLAFHPITKELWEAEMGPRGGDEINIIEKGKNYGWPDVTYGTEYWGPKIGTTQKKGTVPPLVHWTPSISPSAMAFYTGDKFTGWKNNVFLANLSSQHLRRLVFDGRKVVEQEELLKDQGTRFRNVRTGPDGHLYVSSDDGKIARLTYQK